MGIADWPTVLKSLLKRQGPWSRLPGWTEWAGWTQTGSDGLPRSWRLRTPTASRLQAGDPGEAVRQRTRAVPPSTSRVLFRPSTGRMMPPAWVRATCSLRLPNAKPSLSETPRNDVHPHIQAPRDPGKLTHKIKYSSHTARLFWKGFSYHDVLSSNVRRYRSAHRAPRASTQPPTQTAPEECLVVKPMWRRSEPVWPWICDDGSLDARTLTFSVGEFRGQNGNPVSWLTHKAPSSLETKWALNKSPQVAEKSMRTPESSSDGPPSRPGLIRLLPLWSGSPAARSHWPVASGSVTKTSLPAREGSKMRSPMARAGRKERLCSTPEGAATVGVLQAVGRRREQVGSAQRGANLPGFRSPKPRNAWRRLAHPVMI